MLRRYTSDFDRLIASEVNLMDPPPANRGMPIWYDLFQPTPHQDNYIEKLLTIELPTHEEMKEIELSGRLYNENGAEFMTITAVTQMDTEAPQSTPITFVLKDNILITVRYMESRAFANLHSKGEKPGAVPCSSAEQIMFSLIEALTDRMADTLQRIHLDLDTISANIFKRRTRGTSATTEELQDVIELIGKNGNLLAQLRESLVSINRMLTYHTAIEHTDQKALKDARAHTKIIFRDVVALAEQASYLTTTVNFLLDATLGLINLQQNQIIKTFSVAAVIFLPPTLVASIYGMNFAHMPELAWTTGYPLAVLMMLLSAALPYLFFKHKGWL